MKRATLWMLATAIVVSSSAACDTPIGPSNPSGSGSQSAPPAPPTGPAQTYIISGGITEYHGGPIRGVTVGVYPNLIAPGLAWTKTETDEEGHYVLAGLTGRVILEVRRDGYTGARKYNLPPEDQAVGLVLHPSVKAIVGEGISGTIWGDEFVTSADELGGFCRDTACKVVQFGRCYGGRAEIRLRWSDQANELALYVPRGSVYLPIGLVGSVERLCCSAELVASYTFNGDCTDYFAIGFEQAGGTSPGRHQGQAFELTIRPIP